MPDGCSGQSGAYAPERARRGRAAWAAAWAMDGVWGVRFEVEGTVRSISYAAWVRWGLCAVSRRTGVGWRPRTEDWARRATEADKRRAHGPATRVGSSRVGIKMS